MIAHFRRAVVRRCRRSLVNLETQAVRERDFRLIGSRILDLSEFGMLVAPDAPVEIGDPLTSENGNMIGPTQQGVEDLIALDPGADWDPATNTVTGSCAQAATPCAGHSPRIVAIPVFDTGAYYAGKLTGQVNFTVVNILGFFIDRMDGNDVVGYLTEAPGLSTGNATISPESSFLAQIQLVR